MAAEEGILIKIGADVNDAVKNIAKAEQSLTEMANTAQTSAKSAGSALEGASKSISTSSSKIAAETLKAGNSLKALKPGATQAGAALTDFGRIAQDSAFGPTAISNNIVPLVESFGRLKAETGSVKGAMSALLTSMTGGGGLIFAFSLVSAAIGFASMGLGAWTRNFGGNKQAMDDSKKSADEYASSIKSIVSTLSKEATQVSGLVSALQSDTLARQQKVTALKELQSISPDYFGNLKLEKGLVNNLTSAYGSYLSALKERFKVKSLDNELDKLFNKKLDLEVSLDNNAKTFLSKDTSDRISRFEGQIKELGGRKILEGADFTKYTEAQKKVESLSNAITLLQSKTKLDKIGDNAASAELNRINKQIDGLLDRRKQLANFDVKFTKDPKPKKEKDEDTIGDIMQRLALAKEAINIEETATGKVLDPQRISAIQAAIKDLLDIKVSATSDTVRRLSDEIKSLTRPEYKKVSVLTEREERKQSKPFNETFEKDIISRDNLGGVRGGTLHILDQIIEKQAAAKKSAIDYNNAINDVGRSLVSTFENVFTELIEGGGNALKIFGRFIQAVIMKLIAAAAVAAILTAVTGGSFGGAAIKGGTNFMSRFSEMGGIPFHAAGGITTGPHVALVGDNPSGNEAIIPFERMGEFLNNFGGGGGGTLETRISGDDLVVVLNRANARRNRSYGGG